MVSPVFHRMICGDFKEGASKKLELADTDSKTFNKMQELACGLGETQLNSLIDTVEIGKLAEKYQIPEMVAAIEDAVLPCLKVESCAEVLTASTASGLHRVEEKSRGMALLQFREMSHSIGFMSMSEGVLDSLLSDDGLVVGAEEEAFEALAKWMKGGATGLRGMELLRKIRFPSMGHEYLTTRAASVIPGVGLVSDLVSEAQVVQRTPVDQRHTLQLQHLCSSALLPRNASRGLSKVKTLKTSAYGTVCMIDCQQYVCSGARVDGIVIWDKSTRNIKRKLKVSYDQEVWSLTAYGNDLISGLSDRTIIIWDLETGNTKQVLDDHRSGVLSLAVCGNQLASGSKDHTIKLWSKENDEWLCNKTLKGHEGGVLTLTAYQNLVISGSADNTIRVWDAEDGSQQALLQGHAGHVTALLVHNGQLISSSQDGTIRVWTLSLWTLLKTLQVYPADSCQWVRCLSTCGGKMISGSSSFEYCHDERFEVRLWDIERMHCEQTIRLKEGKQVVTMVGFEQQIWVAVEPEIVIWRLA